MSLVLLAVPLGLVTGAILGFLGAGGSVLTVPALVYLLDQPVDSATTAALMIVSANAFLGATVNARRGSIDLPLAIRFAPASIVGAVAGTALSGLTDGETILALLGIVMLASAWFLWRGRPQDARVAARGRGPRLALIVTLGLGVGVLTGFFGVGGGFLIVPALVLLLGVPIREAVGTSLSIIAVTALAGLAGHLVTGGLSWPITIVFAAGGMVGVLVSARWSGRVGGATLSRAFALMLVALAVFLLVQNAAALGV